MERTATIQQVAEEFDVAEATVRVWTSRGCPFSRVGKRNLFNLGEVAQWKKANHLTGEPGRPVTDTPDLEAVKLRKETALATKYELQVARERAELVPIEDVKREWLSRVTTTRNKFLGFGAAIAPQLQGLDAAAAQTMIDQRITEILHELAASAA